MSTRDQVPAIILPGSFHRVADVLNTWLAVVVVGGDGGRTRRKRW